MSTTYKTIDGDTFDTISRKVYGIETGSSRISQSNPGAVEPFVAGIELIIPPDPAAPLNKVQGAPSDNIDEIAVIIGGTRFRFWTSVTINRAIDSMDTISVSAPFEPDAPGFKERFKPFSFQSLSVTVGGAPLFTGTMIDVSPDLEPRQRAVSIDGYALPGVLNDCTAPESSYPIEYDNQGLAAISDSIIAPFGLSTQFDAPEGAVFDRVACNPSKKILSFLTGLSRQRNLVIGSTSEGKLRFSQSVDNGDPVAVLRGGSSPVLSISSSFNPQEYYSHITGIEPSLVEGALAGNKFTVKNEQLTGITRPFTFSAPDNAGASLKDAVGAKIGRMFGNMASYQVSVSTWRDPSGALWTPNTIINLTAPDAMVYNAFNFIIRNVSFSATRSSRTAVLELVLPGSFSGVQPESLPWDL